MPFVKGDVNINRNGRPKGSANRAAEELRRLLHTFIEGKMPELERIWQQLDAKEKLGFLDRMLKHTLPAPKTGDMLDDLSDNDLDKLIERLRKTVN
jgi:hypothetical protein